MIFPDKSYISNGKINIIISNIISDINRAIDQKDYIIAYESMNFLNTLYSNSNNFIESNIEILKYKLDKRRDKRIGELSFDILNNTKVNFLPKNNTSKIIVGDRYNKIEKLLGASSDIKKRLFLDNEYLMIVYSINNMYYRLYFKDNVLFEIEEIK